MNLIERIENVQELIHQLEVSCHRQTGSVELLAVSKKHSIQDIKWAYEAGLRNFGENYLQEALIKIHALASFPIYWHFIGAIQGNKTQAIAHNFSWVHSICRKNIAQRLNDHRPATMPPLNVCIQVNIDDEETKSGIKPDLVSDLATAIIELPQLYLRGLMVIPRPTLDVEQQYLTFLKVTNLLHELNAKLNLKMDTLSMGMSDDLSAAIRAGSTMVRIGRSIFGERYEH